MLGSQATNTLSGALYHVILRGNGGADLFFEDGDRRQFLGLVEQGVVRIGSVSPGLVSV